MLGPILFLLYINDLPQNIKSASEIIIYADDTNIITAASSIDQLEIKTTLALREIREWCLFNKLILNENKTKLMFFKSVQSRIDYSIDIVINNIKIKETKVSKFLGIFIQNNLKWDQHIFNLCKNLSKFVYVMKRANVLASPDIVKTIYYGHVYCLSCVKVWYCSVGS